MGAGHAAMLHASVPDAVVAAVHDFSTERAAALAAQVGADVAAGAEELVAGVDAVVIASPDPTHADLVRLCLEAGRPALCEKPLAPTPEESAALVALEGDRRLVQVGFMRRYDPALVALRERLRAGELGEPRVLHCVHRNASSATSTSDETLVTGSMIHELDQVRWLLDDEIESVEIRSPLAEGFRDPQVGLLRMRSGVLVTTEVFVNARYGYEVRCELAGTGATAVADGPVTDGFLDRFTDAYRAELADWAAAASAGTASGASMLDGHRATEAAAAGVESLRTGQAVAVGPPQSGLPAEK
ncbi:inositol 2-dehydrogenase [Nocardioides mangrovicus]|uniref:Inositol 2-dehydrogenase n=2 Tax=Nocardioides mangrovicus TaxID=2478913 RepID=A0A3L8P3W6_9ACTN|nr:inositol 2-dehydrogenase [Nocardioides mangrovicus]